MNQEQLRPDLKIMAKLDSGGCLVVDERSGQEYEFGEVEHWLIEGIRAGKTAEVLQRECNVRFSLDYQPEDILEFLRLLSQWGLMAKVEEDSVSPQPLLPQPLPSGHWHWFNPHALFGLLLQVFYPLRILVWLTPLAFAIGAACIAARPEAFKTDLAGAYTHFGILGRLLFAALSVNLASQLVRGMVARHFSLGASSFGMVLAFGCIPRFSVHLVPDGQPDRHVRLWLNATSTLVRLWLFTLGAVTWAVLRHNGSMLALVGVELALISLVGLLFVANPLWNGDGARFLSALLGSRDLHRQARNALQAFFIRSPAVIARHQKNSLVLGVLGLFSILVTFCFFIFVGYKSFIYLESRYHGTGVILFLLVGGYVSFKLKQASVQPLGGKVSSRVQICQSYLWRWTLFLLFMILAIIPYRYETGGDAEVLPLARASIAPEMDGLIEEVFVRSGQQVKAGDVLAQMADYAYLNEIRVIEADIAAKQNEILRFQTTPSVAEIKLAEERVNTARIQLSHAESKLQRQAALVERGFVSPQSYDDTVRDVDRDRQLLAETLSSLQAVKAQMNPYHIALLRDELKKMKHKADHYREQLRRTRLTAPFDGRIVTSDIQYQRNSYHEAGQLFAEIEDTQTVFVRVAVPEFDMNDVAPGAAVRVKFWAFPQREFTGVVEEIEPATADESYGRVVYVKTRFSNQQALLKSGLTGFAKIQGQETMLALAFSRALVRFIGIEAWSWLP